MTSFQEVKESVSAYASHRQWGLRREDEATCREVRQKLDAGIALFRTLQNVEDTLVRMAAGNPLRDAGQFTGEIDAVYREWVGTSRTYQRMAKALTREGHSIENLDEFVATLEEAEWMLGNSELESHLPSIEELKAFVQPNNPDPARYGD